MKMIPETRLYIEVEVCTDAGIWWPGIVEHRRQRGGRPEAWVRYTTGVGETRIGWFDARDVRRVGRRERAGGELPTPPTSSGNQLGADSASDDDPGLA